MAKTNSKHKTAKLTSVRQGYTYITPSGYKFVIADNGAVRVIDANDELLMSIENGDILIAASKVKPVVEGDSVDEESAVTPVGEEWEDELFRQHNVFEKLIVQTKDAKPSSNWRAELDEL